MQACSNGHNNPDDSLFCGDCGERLVPITPRPGALDETTEMVSTSDEYTLDQQPAQDAAAASARTEDQTIPGGSPVHSVAAEAAGWYADPSHRYEQRYWDGTLWTEHVTAAGTQTVTSDPITEPGTSSTGEQWNDDQQSDAPSTEPTTELPSTTAQVVPPISTARTGQRRKWPWIAVGIACGLLIGLGTGALAFSNQNDVDQLQKEVTARTRERDAAQAKVNSREARRRADLAHVAAEKATQEAAKRKAAAKAAADAQAAADAKAAADAQAAAEAAKKDSFSGDGVRAVGAEINPGLWHTDGGVANCYYAILNSTDTTNIADNNNTTGPASVTLPAGKYFETSGCTDWHRIG